MSTENLPYALNLEGQPPAVAKLLTELAENPLHTFEWLDGHLSKVLDEGIQRELDDAIPLGLPADVRAEVESAVLYRMMMNAGAAVASFSTSQTRNLMASLRFRCLQQRFRDTARARAYSADCLRVLDEAQDLLNKQSDAAA